MRVGHRVPLAGLCLALYSLHVLNRHVNMIQTNKTNSTCSLYWDRQRPATGRKCPTLRRLAAHTVSALPHRYDITWHGQSAELAGASYWCAHGMWIFYRTVVALTITLPITHISTTLDRFRLFVRNKWRPLFSTFRLFRGRQKLANGTQNLIPTSDN